MQNIHLQIEEAMVELAIQKDVIIETLFRESAPIMIPSLSVTVDTDLAAIPNLKNKLKWRGIKLINQILENNDNVFWLEQKGKIISRKITLKFPKHNIK